jgi:hypothetical protein
MWICLWFYQGKMVYPTSLSDIVPFLRRMGTHAYEVGHVEFSVDDREHTLRNLHGQVISD